MENQEKEIRTCQDFSLGMETVLNAWTPTLTVA